MERLEAISPPPRLCTPEPYPLIGLLIAGFYAPVHRALTEPILLGGAPRRSSTAHSPPMLGSDYVCGFAALLSGTIFAFTIFAIGNEEYELG